MTEVLDVFLCLGAVGLLLPALVLVFEVIAALIPPPGRVASDVASPPRVTILVPAHNEASQIVATVLALQGELPPGGQILVVADNCTDDTATLASAAGAAVLERHDPARVGKGFAISFALDHLAAAPPEIVVLVDSDCRVSSGGIARLAAMAMREGRPVQGEYLLGVPQRAGPMAVVGALAVLVRNRVRPRGLARMRFPCQLTGSGMAFPWAILRAAPAAGDNLVEDLVTGVELALRGHPPLLCPEVQISSALPAGTAAGLRQRRRWEHGQLQTLATYVPRLLAAGLRRRRGGLVAMGLDLLVPPLALLVFVQTVWFALTLGLALGDFGSFTPFVLTATSLLLVTIAVGAAWFGFGRQTLRLQQLALIPVYLVWKLPLYVTLALRGGHKKWERTARPGEPPEGAVG